jgi:transcriptional regulator with XRE-family HTH domain
VTAAPRIAGDRLRNQLLLRGLDQGDLVRLSGLSPATVSRACNGATVTASTLTRIVGTLSKIPVAPLAAELLDVGENGSG